MRTVPFLKETTIFKLSIRYSEVLNSAAMHLKSATFGCIQISLSLLIIQVPSNPRSGETIQLICNYDLGKDSLYVFKMYKDNSEFYRFIPLSQEKKQEFALQGITLDLSKCNETTVTLVKIDTLTTGNFTCEVSVEESFETAPMVKEMIVKSECFACVSHFE
ncbi:uncharacterized protein B4U80_02996 [Leptotrombidium deliense]|uniref:Ig-like domain-containing protein n=1 Tax=Leptotrombidium deliense TaxID=299467 RepID=A0A443SAL0_9ACAR|nr:uncharacterized protein B4U80_02996 [Leptotrombidium deliense]